MKLWLTQSFDSQIYNFSIPPFVLVTLTSNLIRGLPDTLPNDRLDFDAAFLSTPPSSFSVSHKAEFVFNFPEAVSGLQEMAVTLPVSSLVEMSETCHELGWCISRSSSADFQDYLLLIVSVELSHLIYILRLKIFLLFGPRHHTLCSLLMEGSRSTIFIYIRKPSSRRCIPMFRMYFPTYYILRVARIFSTIISFITLHKTIQKPIESPLLYIFTKPNHTLKNATFLINFRTSPKMTIPSPSQSSLLRMSRSTSPSMACCSTN